MSELNKGKVLERLFEKLKGMSSGMIPLEVECHKELYADIDSWAVDMSVAYGLLECDPNEFMALGVSMDELVESKVTSRKYLYVKSDEGCNWLASTNPEFKADSFMAVALDWGLDLDVVFKVKP